MDKPILRAIMALILTIGILALGNGWRLVMPAVAWPATSTEPESVPVPSNDLGPSSQPSPAQRWIPSVRKSTSPERGRDLVQVMTYNIHHGRGLSGELDLGEIAAVIEASGADIIGLQEVDRNYGQRSNYQDQPELLANRLNMQYVYGESLRVRHLRPGRGIGYYGNMILSRYPILESQILRLPNQWGSEPRTALKTIIEIPSGPIAVWVTHLGLSNVEREAQVGRLLEAIAEEELPSIVLGDFNAVAETPEIRALANQFQDVGRVLAFDNMGTFYGDPLAPMPRIDYIWATHGLQPASYKVIPSRASDHLAVTANLVVSSEGRQVQTTKRRGEFK
ncbi:MAG: hypothetical protein GX986_10660 [Firmicutes bacterium]|nr:hypothetical protein [Bacillota bacterium]